MIPSFTKAIARKEFQARPMLLAVRLGFAPQGCDRLRQTSLGPGVVEGRAGLLEEGKGRRAPGPRPQGYLAEIQLSSLNKPLPSLISSSSVRKIVHSKLSQRQACK